MRFGNWSSQYFFVLGVFVGSMGGGGVWWCYFLWSWYAYSKCANEEKLLWRWSYWLLGLSFRIDLICLMSSGFVLFDLSRMMLGDLIWNGCRKISGSREIILYLYYLSHLLNNWRVWKRSIRWWWVRREKEPHYFLDPIWFRCVHWPRIAHAMSQCKPTIRLPSLRKNRPPPKHLHSSYLIR